MTVSFGELELSNLTFWSLVIITLLFVISFILSTIPLTKNIKDTQNISSKKIENQLLEERNLIFEDEDSKHTDMPNISIKREHWANRDFSEYKDAA